MAVQYLAVVGRLRSRCSGSNALCNVYLVLVKSNVVFDVLGFALLHFGLVGQCDIAMETAGLTEQDG